MVTDAIPPYDLEAFERLDAILAEREEVALEVGADALRAIATCGCSTCSSMPPASRSSQRPQRTVLEGLPPAGPRHLGRARQAGPQAHPRRTTTTLWHEARIKAKQARYAAEAVTDVLGKPAARMASAAKPAQEVLGDHQDAAIAADTLNDLGHAHLDDGALCLVAGRLVQANRCAVADSRASVRARLERRSQGGGLTPWLAAFRPLAGVASACTAMPRC